MRPNVYAGRHVGPLGPFRVYTIDHGSWRWTEDDGLSEGPYSTSKAAYEAACGQQTAEIESPAETPWQDALWRAAGFLTTLGLFGALAWVLIVLAAAVHS